MTSPALHRASYVFIHDNPGISLLDWSELHYTRSNENFILAIKKLRACHAVRIEGSLRADPREVKLWPLARLV